MERAKATSATSRITMGFWGFFTFMSLIKRTPTTRTATWMISRKFFPHPLRRRYKNGRMIAMEVIGKPW